jgi:hypothetical protein
VFFDILSTLPPEFRKDVLGNARVYGDRIDIGAVENQGVNPAGAPVFVNANAPVTSTQDGSSWTNAFRNLQDALRIYGGKNPIWVAQGTYYPTTQNDPNASFVLKGRVELYGGFAGNEADMLQRTNWRAHPTILSGAIPGGNSLHVVTATNVGYTTVLDGFTVTKGRAGAGDGGGIYLKNAFPTIQNCLIVDNSATRGGGLFLDGEVYFDGLLNTRFENNTATIAAQLAGEPNRIAGQRG